MSPRSSNTDPQPDVYVGLLFVSVAALITGCIFLALEMSRYGWQI